MFSVNCSMMCDISGTVLDIVRKDFSLAAELHGNISPIKLNNVILMNVAL